MVNAAIDEVRQGPQEESEVVQAAIAGDSAAFNKVVLLYQKRVFRLAFGFFRDREDSMEIVQETFFKVFKNLNRFREGTNFSSWLFRIATNLCIDRYRKMRGKFNCDVDWQRFSHTESETVTDPVEIVMREGFEDSLKKSLKHLSKRQRAVFVLKHESDLKYREIADVLEISVGTVKSLHHRAIHKIRTCLSAGGTQNE